MHNIHHPLIILLMIMMDSDLLKTVEELNKIETKMAELMIEGQLTDEEIDEELSKMDSPLQQESVVE